MIDNSLVHIAVALCPLRGWNDDSEPIDWESSIKSIVRPGASVMVFLDPDKEGNSSKENDKPPPLVR